MSVSEKNIPGAGEALRKGFSAARRRIGVARLVLGLNLLVAMFVALPLYYAIVKFTGHSKVATDLLQGFPPDWILDFRYNNPGWFTRFGQAVLAGGLISLLLNTLLAGGMLGALRNPQIFFPARDFFQDILRYGARLLRLLILGLVCYWVVFWVLNVGVRGLLERWAERSTNNLWISVIEVSLAVLILAGLFYINLILDFARIRLVLGEEQKVIGAFRGAWRFVRRRFFKCLTVYLVPGLAALALLGLYRLLMPLVPAGTSWGIMALFLLQQLVMFARYWLRMATWAGEWALFSGSSND